MRKIAIVFLFCIGCALPMVSQDVVEVADQIDSLAVTDDAASSMYSVHYRTDVRHIRDSMMHSIRMAQRDIQRNVRTMRDSVRHKLREDAQLHPHQLRIGCGDQMFETLVWYHQPHASIYPESHMAAYDEDFRYTQHWFAEYQYRLRYWFNLGVMADYSGVLWDRVIRNGLGEGLTREANRNFHNIAIMLTTRFTYLHTQYVSLYSGLGAGVNVNTGSDLDYRDRLTACAPALSLTVLGMQVGNEQWFGAIEFGGMYSLNGIHEVYMAGSRMFTVSVGCRLK